MYQLESKINVLQFINFSGTRKRTLKWSIVAINLIISNNVFTIFNIYRPPGNDKVYMLNLLNCLKTLMHNNQKNKFIIVGDFNLPSINWTDLSRPADDVHDQFVQFVIDNSLFQYVHSPTRMNNILDLVLCNDSHILHDLCVTPPLANSDHASVCCDVFLPPDNNKDKNAEISFLIYDYKNTDYEAFNIYISQVDWGLAFSTCLSAIDFWQVSSYLYQ